MVTAGRRRLRDGNSRKKKVKRWEEQEEEG